MLRNNLLLLAALNIFAVGNCHSQMTRGWQPGEIYLSSPWYYNQQNQLYSGIFYSKDNGRTLGLCYKSLENTDSMPIGTIMSDASDGVLYNIIYNCLYRSTNNGEKWSKIYQDKIGRYLTGCNPGVIFQILYPKLYLSIDFGETFEILSENLNAGVSELGSSYGEMYGWGWNGDPPFTFYYSEDTGSSFNSYILDSEIGGLNAQGHYPKLSRGTFSGEIYLVTWHVPANYKIFRSTDYGQHFNLQYISDTCDFYYEDYDFTAGKTPGSFYVVKYDSRYWGEMTEVTISYSSDSAKTFTSYVHHLDANWVDTAWNNMVQPVNNRVSLLQNYPNPVIDYTTIPYDLDNNINHAFIEISNLSGAVIKNIPVKKNEKIIPVNLTSLPDGIYIYRIKTSSFISKSYKLIKN